MSCWQTDRHTYGWMDGWMNEWMNEWTNEPTNQAINNGVSHKVSSIVSLAAGTRPLKRQLLGWRTGTVCDDNFNQCFPVDFIQICPRAKPLNMGPDTLPASAYSQLLACFKELCHRARLLEASSDHTPFPHASPPSVTKRGRNSRNTTKIYCFNYNIKRKRVTHNN